jgi:hypothetical protein
MKLQGGCLCGEVRFAIEALAGDVVDYCHCSQCRKASGAPVTAWIQVAPARFELTTGEPKSFRSSERGMRWFCPACGSQLYMTDPENRSVGVTLGSLDEPERMKPTVHGWASAAVSWHVIDDDLPRHDRDPPYDL